MVNYTFAIIDINDIKEHERTKSEGLKKLAAKIKKDGVFNEPVVVDKDHYILLDGHHRFNALKLLGAKKVPVFLVDYFDDDIKVDVWPEAIANNITKVTKEEVIKTGSSDELLPPKTTRHIIKANFEYRAVKLEDLM